MTIDSNIDEGKRFNFDANIKEGGSFRVDAHTQKIFGSGFNEDTLDRGDMMVLIKELGNSEKRDMSAL